FCSRMVIRPLLQSLLLLVFFARAVDAFVYSCEEVKYRLLNTALEQNTMGACVFAQDNFSNFDQLKNIYVQTDNFKQSLAEIQAHGLNHPCTYVGGIATVNKWRIVADNDFELNCDQEFTLVFINDFSNFLAPFANSIRAKTVQNRAYHLVAPRTGMRVHKTKCTGKGNVTVYTGAGTEEKGKQFELRTWPCESVPDWIFSFDAVITISTDQLTTFDMEYATYLGSSSNMLTVNPGIKICVLTSGRSDDLQNLWKEGSNIVY
ncbi:hypothetical protein PENTCL1PPCAC_21095, partial [Pristionchus entomophagus]